MRSDSKQSLGFLAVFVSIALLTAGCVGDSAEGSADPEPDTPRHGGTFRMVAVHDVDFIDPGQSYYAPAYTLARATSRTLVAYPPLEGPEGTKLVADIATNTGEVSSDGLTWSFTIREGVRYQPETAAGRQVRSEDFRYAIERGFKTSVANGYVNNYFRNVIVGDDEFADGKAEHIAGIDVRDPTRVVMHLRRPTADLGYRLSLTVAAPVPEEYAAPFDAAPQSALGANFAATGPYMLERTGGKVTGYRSGTLIRLVRNPNWDQGTDELRKAYVDAIEVREGFEAPAGTEKIRNGEFDYHFDFGPPPDKLRLIAENKRQAKRLSFDPSSCFSYVSLTSSIKPLDNVKVRQAIQFVIDKKAIQLALGGPRPGTVAGHLLVPGLPGFAEVGGEGYDPYPSHNSAGDVNRARALMIEAGYPGGLYRGPPLLMVGSDGSPRVDNVVQASLEKIGIRVRRETYATDAFITKYQGVPSAGVAISTGGWCWDYPDGATLIKPLFDGRLITESGNVNTTLLNDPGVNDLIDRATEAEGEERGRLWGEADRRVMELAPMVPLRWIRPANFVSARVRGARYPIGLSASIDLGTVWLSGGSK